MATQQTIDSLIQYYVSLLIIQYHNKPKAQATIGLMAKECLANGILLDIQNGYNLETAIGVQLDVIGKYEGIDRFYKDLNLIDFFSLETYGEAPPSSPPRYGFTDYAHYDTTPPKGTLKYSDTIAGNFVLDDDSFRTLIKLRIVQNYSNHSDGSIDSGIFLFFPTTLWVEDMLNMHMVYFATVDISAVIKAAIYKKVLPRPEGVGALVVEDISGPMFAFGDYNNFESVYGHGFCTYADYDATAGQVLLYNQITEY